MDVLVDQILRRSAIDPEFRELAIAEPSSAIAKFNPEIAKNTTLRFIDSELTRTRDLEEAIVLPQSSLEELELSDAELEEFIGAQCGCTCCNSCGDSCGSTCFCTACCITC